MASLLKNSVGDLKAEWLLMKREIDTLKVLLVLPDYGRTYKNVSL
jgi:hypothetical protein